MNITPNSKYEILHKQMEDARAEYRRLQEYLDGLHGTTCGLTCSGCGTLLETEADFAAHFFVNRMDRINNNLNLGSCPIKDKR